MRGEPAYYKNHDNSKNIIEFDFWQPFSEWISNLVWGCTSKHLSKYEQRRSKCCTCIELYFAF